MPFTHLMSLKLIKASQKCSIFWNLLGVLKNKVLVKKFQICATFTLFPRNFSKPPQDICHIRIY